VQSQHLSSFVVVFERKKNQMLNKMSKKLELVQIFRYSTLAVLCSIQLSLFAQPKARITGTTIDKSSQQIIAGATVRIQNRNLSTTSDEKGRFELKEITPGSVNLEVTAVGYQKFILSNLVVTTGNDIELQIELE